MRQQHHPTLNLLPDDLVAEANLNFDDHYPKSDGYYTLPLPDWFDPAPPGFCKDGALNKELDEEVWPWIRRGISDGERVPILHAHFRTAEP